MIIPSKENYINNEFINTNDELLKLEGFLDEEQARITLAQFLRANLGFTCEIISGVKLAKYQEMTLNALFQANYSMLVWSRGASKTFIAAVFCYMYCIFHPGSKIIIAGPTFRTARFIFGKLEEIVSSKEAVLLEQCMPIKQRSKRNDVFEWEVNGGKISAIPLAGEKIRGFRASVLIIDEANWVDKDIIEKVLMPFLVAPKDMKERLITREREDEQIKRGSLKEEDRTVYTSDIKMILLSSAGYTFEHLYALYCEWLAKIKGESEAPELIRYFISQMAWDSLPYGMMDKTVIDEASKGGNLSPSFKMEYGAIFQDGSDSYFNAKKMEGVTLKVGEYPHTLIKGDPNKKYILSIDPNNSSDSPTADYFAMSVLELDEETKGATLVNGYQGLENLNDHVKYLAYVFSNFSIVLIIGDSSGLDSFISAANNSEEFETLRINLKYLDFDSCLEGEEYEQALAIAKKEYNREGGKIVIRQAFYTESIRRMNEHLQNCIEYKKIWFASATVPNESIIESQLKISLPNFLIREHKQFKEMSSLDFIDKQDEIIKSTKKQCAIVELTTTTKGGIDFDLPQHMKRMKSPDRPRKDNYSTLLLANWGNKIYYDIMRTPEKKRTAMFIPKMSRV